MVRVLRRAVEEWQRVRVDVRAERYQGSGQKACRHACQKEYRDNLPLTGAAVEMWHSEDCCCRVVSM